MYKISFVLIATIFFLLAGCSGAERFTGKEKDIPKKNDGSPEKIKSTGNLLNSVRVLLKNSQNEIAYVVKTPVTLTDSKNKIALIKPGNVLLLEIDEDFVRLIIDEQKFVSEYFEIIADDSTKLLHFDNKQYRGKIRFASSSGELKVINIINLEDYLKGVIPSEMPIGKGEVNLEALKAFAICARTYSLMKMNMNQDDFDLHIDVRDQVYGGADNEKQLSSRAVDETKGFVLFYNDNPATTFYHSTCGGQTENSKNVFTKDELPYLSGVVDGNPSYCKNSPRYSWKEILSRNEFVTRLAKAELITDQNCELENVEVKSRFESGRINELEITIVENEDLQRKFSLFGNNIRAVIRTADNKSILFSSMFEIELDGNNVIINGRGYGHGVGLCQYGSIGLAHSGSKYSEILIHYFPGTQIKSIYE